MFDTAFNDQFPAGAAAYAGYVDGDIGNQPNYAHIVSAFPKAQHLSIALFSSNNADVLDVEPGASDASDIPGWHSRQVARGIRRPVIYASASTMDTQVLSVLSEAGIARANTRLWTAHYGVGEHICGPDSCGALSVNADGTQWTSAAEGLVLDQSLLLEDFFTTTPTPTSTGPTSGSTTPRRTCRRPGCGWRSSTPRGASTRTWWSTAARDWRFSSSPTPARLAWCPSAAMTRARPRSATSSTSDPAATGRARPRTRRGG